MDVEEYCWLHVSVLWNGTVQSSVQGGLTYTTVMSLVVVVNSIIWQWMIGTVFPRIVSAELIFFRS